MTSRPIVDPLAGERLLAVEPQPGLGARGGPHRLNLFSGRALSDVALRIQQQHWQRRLRQLARLRAPGVVRGLEVVEEQPRTDEQWLQLNPGLGLSVEGEDVWLPRPMRIRFSSLPVLSGAVSPTGSTTATSSRLWILVLRPVSVLEADAADPNRCNEWDDSGRAFEEETRRDGTLLGRVPLVDVLASEGRGRLLDTRTGHGVTVTSVSWSPDGAQLASGGWGDKITGGTLRLGNPLSAAEQVVLKDARSLTVTCVSWSPDGTRLASAGRDGSVRVWKSDSATGASPVVELKGHVGWVFSLGWNPAGTRLVSGGRDGTVRVWDPRIEGSPELGQLKAHAGPVRCLSWSPDGEWLATGGDDGSVRIWHMAESAMRASFNTDDGPVRCLSWSPDGRRLASGGGRKGAILVWDWNSDSSDLGSPLAELKGHQQRVTSLSWSADGARLASGSRDGRVLVWAGTRESDAEPLAVLAGHNGAVTSVSWSPDGTRLASAGGQDATVRLWLLASPEQGWRNALAQALIAWELDSKKKGGVLPWDRLGVPIGLIALTPDLQRIAFVDSAAVVRQGGGPRETTALRPGLPQGALVSARVRQFAEQLAELLAERATTSEPTELWLRRAVVPSFRYLPPFGLLPRSALAEQPLQRRGSGVPITTTQCVFFPPSWRVQLAPIPQEQLELALRDSAALDPFDLEHPDQVQLWLPVPQSVYEPDLLLEDAEDPIFQQRIEAFTARRNDRLYRRGWLRRRLAAITRAIRGQAALFETPDPGQLDAAEPQDNVAADAPDRDADLVRYFNRAALLSTRLERTEADSSRKMVVSGDLGFRRQPGLLFYTPDRGEIDLCPVDARNGIPGVPQKIDGCRRTWSLIVSGLFTTQEADNPQLLFYDQVAGEIEIYFPRGDEGLLDLDCNLRGLSRSWQRIVPGRFGQASLLCYDSAAGVLEFFAVTKNNQTDTSGAQLNTASLRSVKRHSQIRTSWTLIVPGNFGGDSRRSELLFYDQSAGEGALYAVSETGDLLLLKTYTGWRKSWSSILPGRFGEGPFTDLVFHDHSQSEAEVYQVDKERALSLLRACWLPASPGSGFGVGRFGFSPDRDGVFVDDPLGPPEEEYGTWHLLVRLPRMADISLRNVAPLLRLQSQLLDSSPIDTDAEVLLTQLLDPADKARGRKVLPDAILVSLQADLEAIAPGKYGYESGSGLLKIKGVMTGQERISLKQKFKESVYSEFFEAAAVDVAIDGLHVSSQDNTKLLGLDVRSAAFTGLESFIEQLELATAQTDDSLEFGFLQVRTSMYRIRQQVLGQEEAMKLATSPTLAEIASRETARASQDELNRYFQKIKVETTTLKGDATPAMTGPAAPAPAPASAQGQPAGAFNASFTRFSQHDNSLFRAAALPRLDPSGKAASDVLNQAPIVGHVVETIAVAERLQQPAAIEVSDFAFSDQVKVLDGLGRKGLLKDLLVPGKEGVTFGKLRPGTLQPPEVARPTEAEFFSNAVRSLDLTVAALRLGEGRVQQYRQAIARCRDSLNALRQQQGRLEARLRVVDSELAEVRQDLSVAQALLAEERARVQAINARRRRVLKDQVPYLAFQRPRSLNLLQTPPCLPLDPGPSPDPLPPCWNDSTPVPREVRAMVELLREAPLGWFKSLLPELRRLDRIDTLVRLFDSAAQRRSVITPTAPQPLAAPEVSSTPFGRSIRRLYDQRQQMVRQAWQGVATQATPAVAAQSWQESLRQAERCLTLGDLLAGDHHRPELSSQAASLLQQWCRVATCLKERFGAIPPQLRLDWAERLSQFDGPVNLRLLTNLPRWGEVSDGRQRRDLQSLVDWLFQQVNSVEDPAIAFANDLVRLSLLLACHAPVNQILSGQVIGSPSLAPQARLPIRMDPLRVRVGMPVLFHGRDGVMAEGIVEDLSGTVATARILRGNASLSADANTRVQFLRQPLT
ncbi:MAG: WD40 repeat domain-containing protein [Synechococcaceae cyanobacterium]|nr:WD40 repeat domain-containing protein [Synechococcaceae cyanobacterium]